MVLDRKQFEDFDDFSDFDDKLDPGSDLESPGGMRGNSSLGWRRAIIERAAISVRKAVELKTDLKTTYKNGALVFDEESNKFGRVIESRPGFLNLSLLSGGKLVKQHIDRIGFIRQNRQTLTLPELSKELFLSEVEVISLLNQIELEQENNKPAIAAKSTPKAKVVASKPAKKPDLKVLAPQKPKLISKAGKPTIKIAAKSKPKAKKAPSFAKDASLSFAKLLPKGVSTDPVVDPNGYIKQNFQVMSNKELARATSLSEHTIRRKLGEWGLKRKDSAIKVKPL